MTKNKVINFDFENNCYGCRNCENICPKKAIKMIKNEEGFIIPKIDYEKCIDCGLCTQKCPYLQNNQETLMKEKWYGGYLKDEKERIQSTSGGMFTALANWFLDNDGYVCGCVWNEELEATHIITNKIKDIQRMRGSKYVQSNLNSCALEIKKLLAHHKVLFTGTPCQVAAIKKYNENNENLYTMAIICEGVSSPKVWKKYVNYLENKYKSKLINVQFRNKEVGWEPPVIKFFFKNGIVKSCLTFSTDLYGKAFLQGMTYRKSCNNCQYKLSGYNADIIVGDLWGAKKTIIEESDNKGISAILVNSKKGEELLKQIAPAIKIYSLEPEEIIKNNQKIIKSAELHKNREYFFKNIDNVEIEKNIKKNIILPKNKKIKNIVKEMAYKTKTYNMIRKIIK